jgi:hypothetical protein
MRKMSRSPRDDTKWGVRVPDGTSAAGTAASESVRNSASFAFDPDTVLLLGQVYESAWREFEVTRSGRLSKNARTKASAALTRHLMAAAHIGERDPEKLKLHALQAMGLVVLSCAGTADAAMPSGDHAATGSD